MQKLSGSNNPNIASIYGDAGVQQATYIPDLNQLGADPYVNITTNSGELNIFQQFNIEDNWYDSRYEEMYVTQNSSGSGANYTLASIQGNTMGWVRTDQMILMVPVVITTYAFGTGASAAQNDWQYIAPRRRIIAAAQPDFALFEVFNKIAIYLGYNNQPCARTQQFFRDGMKAALADLKLDANSQRILAQWGLPTSMLSQTPTGATAGLPPLATGFTDDTGYTTLGGVVEASQGDCIGNPAVEALDIEWIKTWVTTLLSVSEYGNINTGAPQRTQTIGGNVYQGRVAQLNLPLPLYWINNFFRGKQYLPPDFKFKIDVEGYGDSVSTTIGNPVTIAIGGLWPPPTYTVNSGVAILVTNFFATAGINFSAMKLIYINNTLRQPLQAEINQKWIRYPLLYNYETMESYEIDASNSSNGTMIVRDIAISQQRPTTLLFRFLDNVSSAAWTSPYSTGGIPSLTDTPITINNSISPKIVGNSLTTANAYPQILQISVIIGGRTQYYYRNDTNIYPLAGNHYPNVYDCLALQQNKESFNGYSVNSSEKLTIDGQYTGSIGGSGGNNFIMNISPGGRVDRSRVPSDLGATVIRVIINMNNGLANSKKLQIWKKMPEQISVDTNKNVTLIMWPAIKSNNGFAISNVTNAT